MRTQGTMQSRPNRRRNRGAERIGQRHKGAPRADSRVDGGASAPGVGGGEGVPAMGAGLAQAGRGRALAAAQVLLVVAVAVAAQWPRARECDFWFSDASRHALDGVFLIDFVRDGGWTSPYSYGLHYAARYPALGVLYYPPLFAAVEAAVFLVVGPSFEAARATVVLFGVAAGLGLFALGRCLRNGWFGLVAAVCFLTTRDAVVWSRDVMLEMPMAAMSILAMLFLHLWVDRDKRWSAYGCCLSLLGAVMIKQTGVFLFPVVLAYVVLRRRWRLLWRREAIIGYVVLLAVLVPYALFQFRFYKATVVSAVQGSGPTGAEGRIGAASRWLSYLLALPAASSVPLAGLAAVGFVWVLARRRAAEEKLFVLWFAVAYLLASYVAPCRSRYVFVLLPSIAVLATLGLWAVASWRVGRVPVVALAGAVLLAYQAYVAATADVPWVSGAYRRAARLVTEHPRGETVLFHGYHAGNFAFHVRLADRERRQIVLRSDKLFGRVHRLGMANAAFASGVETQTAVEALLRAHGVGYVVVEPNHCSPADPVRPLLLAALGEPPWVERARIPLATHRAKPGSGEVRVYENPEAGQATEACIPFWVPLSRRELQIRYEALRRGFAEGATH